MRSKSSWFGITSMALLLALGVATLTVAEEGGEDKATLTGCLAETDEGDYLLQQQDSDDETTVRGEGLADHVGHTVTVRGKWSEDDEGNAYFMADSVEHVSASCESS